MIFNFYAFVTVTGRRFALTKCRERATLDALEPRKSAARNCMAINGESTRNYYDSDHCCERSKKNVKIMSLDGQSVECK
jgi:hypothetical protein